MKLHFYTGSKYIPDEEGGRHQHHSQVHSDGSLEVESLEFSGGVADKEEEEGGKIGGQKLIDNSSLESYFHLQTFWYYLFYEI